MSVTGSSPLTRGKPILTGAITHCPGLIPAHAGKTPSHPARSGGAWAHPRSRGENQALDPDVLREVGSSPLTRGKPRVVFTTSGVWGLIPAHAGKTDGVGLGRPGLAAHPRSRGENTPPGPLAEGEVGSSPLTRGKLSVLTYSFRCTGLIPAHAGKTEMSSNHPRGCRAHPRSRGENSPFSHIVFGVLGSSPLTRGKHNFARACVIRERLIPAHAGKTRSRLPSFGM